MNTNLANVDLERALIGACLHEETGSRIMSLGVKPEMFTGDEYRAIFRTIAGLTASGASTDCVTVASQMSISGMGDHAEAIGECFNSITTGAQADTWAAMIRDLAGRRQMARLLKNEAAVFETIRDGATEEMRAFRRKFEAAEALMRPAVRMSAEAQGAYFLETLTKLQKGSSGGVIVPWGIKGLDNLCPLQRGQIFALAAGSNTGKTRFLLSDLAFTLQRRPATSDGAYLIFSRENKNRILWEGLLSIMTRIPGRKMSTRDGLTQQDLDCVADFVRYLQQNGHRFRLFGKGEYTPTPAGIFSRVREYEDETGVKASKIAVDYLQNHRCDGKAFGRTEQLENLIQETTMEAADFDAALIILSQLNRNKERTGRPGMNDIKGTTALENEADYLAFLYNPDPMTRGSVHLNFYAQKTRSGVPRWDRTLAFDVGTGTISEVEGVMASEVGF